MIFEDVQSLSSPVFRPLLQKVYNEGKKFEVPCNAVNVFSRLKPINVLQVELVGGIERAKNFSGEPPGQVGVVRDLVRHVLHELSNTLLEVSGYPLGLLADVLHHLGQEGVPVLCRLFGHNLEQAENHI